MFLVDFINTSTACSVVIEKENATMRLWAYLVTKRAAEGTAQTVRSYLRYVYVQLHESNDLPGTAKAYDFLSALPISKSCHSRTFKRKRAV